MGKKIIYAIVFLLFLMVAGSQNYDWRYNPYTGRQDRSVSSNQSGVDFIFGNVTVEKWFNGLFNWTVGDSYATFDGATWLQNESQINATIDARTASTTYNATSIKTVEGTLDSGNLTSVQIAKDGLSYNVSEVAGGSPLLIYVNFTGVIDFNTMIMRHLYIGGQGHEIEICLWEYDDSAWECEYGDITDMDDFAFLNIVVSDSADHINASLNGLVQLKFDHIQNGKSSHDFFLDYIVLVDGFTSITTSNHDALSGRDDIENHPWALDSAATRNITNDLTIESNLLMVGNITNPINRSWGIFNNGTCIVIGDLTQTSSC